MNFSNFRSEADSLLKEYSILYFTKELLSILKSTQVTHFRMDFEHNIDLDDNEINTSPYFRHSDCRWEGDGTYFVIDGKLISADTKIFSKLIESILKIFAGSTYNGTGIFSVYVRLTDSLGIPLNGEISVGELDNYYCNLSKRNAEIMNFNNVFKKLGSDCEIAFHSKIID